MTANLEESQIKYITRSLVTVLPCRVCCPPTNERAPAESPILWVPNKGTPSAWRPPNCKPYKDLISSSSFTVISFVAILSYQQTWRWVKSKISINQICNAFMQIVRSDSIHHICCDLPAGRGSAKAQAISLGGRTLRPSRPLEVSKLWGFILFNLIYLETRIDQYTITKDFVSEDYKPAKEWKNGNGMFIGLWEFNGSPHILAIIVTSLILIPILKCLHS